ncbi:MAG TPA: TRIC cation channel family protein, partial [Bosea sp. (in: a-proteobacteria)]
EAPLNVLICTSVALLAWLIAYRQPGQLDGWSAKRVLLWADASGMALFSVSGTRIALAADVPLISAIALGAVTASFGGILRDILAGDRAMVLWSRDFYVTAATAGAGATALLTYFGMSPAIVTLGGLAAGFGLRAGSILLGWSFPRLPGDGPR